MLELREAEFKITLQAMTHLQIHWSTQTPVKHLK